MTNKNKELTKEAYKDLQKYSDTIHKEQQKNPEWDLDHEPVKKRGRPKKREDKKQKEFQP